MLRGHNRHLLVAATAAMFAASAGTASASNALVPDTLQSLPNPVSAVEAATAKAFPAFRNLPATPMPADAAAAVGSATLYGRNPQLARSINTVTGKGWLIPGRGFVCLAVPDPIDGWGSACAPTDQAATTGIQLLMKGPSTGGGMAVTAIAPAGDATVAVTPTSASVLPSSNGVTSAVVSDAAAVGVVTQ